MNSFQRQNGSTGVSRRSALRWLGLGGGAAILGAGRASAGLDEVLGVAQSVLQAGTAGLTPAPVSLSGAQVGYYRLRIGGMEALALSDGGFSAPADQSPFAVGEAPGAVAAGLAEALLPVEKVEVPFNVLLVKIGNELVLIDAGAGTAFGPTAGKLQANLRAAGVDPARVTAIVLTHAHGDHFGGLLDAEGRSAYPAARIFMARKEHAFWTEGTPNLSGVGLPAEAAVGMAAGARQALTTLRDQLELVAGGDRILNGIELLDTSGHTPGHLALILGEGRDRLLHFADAAHHYALSFAHPGWRFAYDTDAALAAETRRKLFDRAAADGLRLFGAHMPFPALGRVRRLRGGEAYEYVMEPMSLG